MILDVVHEQILNAFVEDYTQRTKSDAKYMEYMISDIAKTYARLESLRKECVDKYCKFISELKVDDIDIVFKYMHEKQTKELKSWNDELNDVLEFKSDIDDVLDSINSGEFSKNTLQEMKETYFS